MATATTSANRPAYGDEIVEKVEELAGTGLAAVQTAQSIALGYVSKGMETLKDLAPQAQDAIQKFDVVDAKHAVDRAFEVASRYLESQRHFVGDVLGTIFDQPEPVKPVKATKPAASPAPAETA